jgi:hypothetical protein
MFTDMLAVATKLKALTTTLAFVYVIDLTVTAFHSDTCVGLCFLSQCLKLATSAIKTHLATELDILVA